MKNLYGILAFLSIIILPTFLHAQENLVFSAVQETVVSNVYEEVLRKAYQQIGIQITIRKLPGKRALLLSSSGNTDGEAFRVRAIEQDYPTLSRIEVPCGVINMTLFVTQGNEFPVNGWESIPKETRLGYLRGVKIVEYNTSKHSIQAEPVDTPKQLFHMLELGRIDAIIEEAMNGLTTIHQFGLQSIVKLEPPLDTFPLYHYLHIKHARLVPKITTVLQNMEARGEIREIQERFEEEMIENMLKDSSR